MNRLFMTSLFFSFSILLFSQTVSTYISNVKVDDALILDKEGNLYGANYNGSEIFIISKDKVISSFAGGFNTPNGMAFDSKGNLFMCDNAGNKIYKITPEKVISALVPNFYNPSGILKMIDSDTMYISSYLGNKIVKMAPDGTIVDFIKSGISGPVGLVYGVNDQLFAAEFGASGASGTRRVFKVEKNGDKSVFSILPGGAIGFITYSKGNLYATSLYSHKIYKIDEGGNATVWLGSTAGNVNGAANIAKFNGPNGIISSIGQDSILVSEFNNRNIRLITNFNTVNAISDLNNHISVSILPNPVTNILNISYHSEKGDIINIYNQLGQAMDSIYVFESSNTFNSTIDFSNQTNGIYFLSIVRHGELLITKKIIK